MGSKICAKPIRHLEISQNKVVFFWPYPLHRFSYAYFVSYLLPAVRFRQLDRSVIRITAGDIENISILPSPFAIISIVFALMFKFLPDAKVKWSAVWIGSNRNVPAFYSG